MGRAASLFVTVGLVGAVSAVAVPGAASGAVPVLIISGKGWGHGVGMAQDGALQMGREGMGLNQILGQFYPGTSIGHGTGDVRVPVLGAGGAPTSASVTFPDGGQVADSLSGGDSPGFPRAVPAGGTAVISWDGSRYSVTTTPVPSGQATSEGPAMQGAPDRREASAMQGAPDGREASAMQGAPDVREASAAGPAVAPTPTLFPPAPTTTAPKGLLPVPLPPVAPKPATTTTTTRPRSPTTTLGGAPGGGGPGGGGGAPPAPGSPGATTLTSTRPIWAIPTGGGALGVPGRGRSYRGDLEAEASTGSLRLINQLDVETYLTGMGEVLDPAWPAASLEAQEVAARTYALRAMATGGELCDDTRCQVYLGTAGEYTAAERAVAATAGEVLVSGGRLADTVYSANAAGYSASPEEGFGSSNGAAPYLRAAPYPTGNPFPWTVSVSTADVAAALGLNAPITGATVSGRGPSGRALTVAVQMGSTTSDVSGLAFASALGLRSTLFSISVGQAASAPPPPPRTSALQVPPELAGAVAPPVAQVGVTTPGGRGLAAPAPLASTPRSTGGGSVAAAAAVALVLLMLTSAAAIRYRLHRR